VSRWIQTFAFAVIVLGLTATCARADLVISLSNVNVAPGNTGTMDISVTSNNSDTLSSFGLELLITRGTSASFLTFTGGPDPYANPNYVFFGQSLNQDTATPFWGPPYQSSPSGYPSDSILGGDSADSSGLGYVTIPSTAGGPNSFLAAVQFQSQPGAPLTDQFQVSLVSNPSFTYFDDQNSSPLNYSTTGGLVTFSVPEPSSLTLAALSGFSGLLWYCWRGRGRKHRPST